MAKYQTQYGYFSEDGDEYVITNFRTPKPWANVISNGEYGLVISQIGSGFSWNEHSEFNRLNRWHQDLIRDDWGKYFYFKNNKTGDVWSPTWMPVKAELENYEARYGFGYAAFQSEYKKIEVELTVFIPMKSNLEIWDFKITNKSQEPLDLSIYTYFEWCLGTSNDHHREFHKQFVETEFNAENNAMLATKRLWEVPLGDRGHWNIEYPYYGFISSNKAIIDFEGDKEEFVGQYNNLDKPAGLMKEALSNKVGKWNDSIGTVHVNANIAPDKCKAIAFYLGIQPTKKNVFETLKKFRTEEQIQNALDEVKKYWDDALGTLEIKTPDDAMDLMINKWARYQAIAGRLLARTAYYQQSGAFGFRDQLQDSLVYLPIDQTLTEKQIRLHARHQFEDGTVLHWWHPISDTGLPTKMTDDLLWLPFVLFHYLDETSNYKILDETEPYYDNKEKLDSLFNHCVAAIEKVLTRFSERGLPLIGAGDWNDGLSAVGLEFKGESVWLAHFFYMILQRFARISEKVGKKELQNRYNKKADELKQAINKFAWDGEWFWRATKDNGEKIGSHECKEGKIYLNAQTWSVICNSSDDERKASAMNSVSKYLLKNNGALLLWPAYTKPDKYIGYLSRYAPARRENGGVYTHAATWAIQAFAMMKDAENAWLAYTKLNPINGGMDPEKYVAEPFVTPGNIDGPDSPNYGMAGWTWYTGSAQWFNKVVLEWILGVRPTEEGLLIDPCIPKDWKEYKVKRTFRGTVYNIVVKNESGVSFGVKEIIVDGVKQKENLIKPVEKPTVKVEVTL